MHGIRRIATVFLIGIGLLAGTASAQTFPEKTIHFLVPFTTGGPSDTLTRAVAAGLAEAIGHPVVVENVPGAGGAVAMARLTRSPADGYTIALISNATHAINPAILGRNLKYDPLADFTFLTGVARWANVLVVNADSPFGSIDDVVRFAKENPTGVSFGSAGIGASNHLSGEMLKRAAGVEMVHVPYKGNAAPMADVIGGRLTFMFEVPVTAKPMIDAGRIRPLAITGTSRSAYLPDVPTISEAGYPAASGEFWFGVAAPAGVPEHIADRLNAELTAVLRSPEIKERLARQSFDPWPTSREELTRDITAEVAKWSEVIKALGLESN